MKVKFEDVPLGGRIVICDTVYVVLETYGRGKVVSESLEPGSRQSICCFTDPGAGVTLDTEVELLGLQPLPIRSDTMLQDEAVLTNPEWLKWCLDAVSNADEDQIEYGLIEVTGDGSFSKEEAIPVIAHHALRLIKQLETPTN